MTNFHRKNSSIIRLYQTRENRAFSLIQYGSIRFGISIDGKENGGLSIDTYLPYLSYFILFCLETDRTGRDRYIFSIPKPRLDEKMRGEFSAEGREGKGKEGRGVELCACVLKSKKKKKDTGRKKERKELQVSVVIFFFSFFFFFSITGLLSDGGRVAIAE